MKHNQLLSVAHNLADSFVSGWSGLVQGWCIDIYGEAAKSPGARIEIDFLAGTVASGQSSDVLEAGASAFRRALPGLCGQHGFSVAEFEKLTVQFSGVSPWNGSAIITLVDRDGRQTVAEYTGLPLKRTMMLDDRGRPRRAKH